MDQSAELFADHEINQVRRETGLNPATQVWFWGQGHAPSMPSFVERYQVARGAMITGVDLLRAWPCCWAGT
jgi:2,3-bisphosphoglycerate-independent phosphoglycerate mutase